MNDIKIKTLVQGTTETEDGFAYRLESYCNKLKETNKETIQSVPSVQISSSQSGRMTAIIQFQVKACKEDPKTEKVVSTAKEALFPRALLEVAYNRFLETTCLETKHKNFYIFLLEQSKEDY